MKNAIIIVLSLVICQVVFAQTTINFTINSALERKTISPYIYGINAYVYDPSWKTGLDNHGSEANLRSMNLGSRRMGGDAISGFNWENGVCNSGFNDNHNNSEFASFIAGCGAPNYNNGAAYYEPAMAPSVFQGHSLHYNSYSLLQLQAANAVGHTCCGVFADTYPNANWDATVSNTVGGVINTTPNINDGVVYMDEQIKFLQNRFGTASTITGIKGYELENEPGLWHNYAANGSTHALMHPALTTCTEIINKTSQTAATVKNMDPNAETFGPAMWGYSEFFSHWSIWDGTSHQPTDWGTYNIEPYLTNNTGDSYRYNHMTWVNAYLAKMKLQSDAAGKRLLDVFSFHYYPAGISDNTIRMQAPRSLWDPTYVENSWITQIGNGFTDGNGLQLLPKMQLSINDFYPGTKMAITEYDFGGRTHYSGAIAQADALGIFGKQGVYLANYFGVADQFISTAFRIFRNYDGNFSTFGNTSIKSTSSNISKATIYASVDADNENLMHVIVINKNSTAINANIAVTSPNVYSSANVWGMNGNNQAITERTAVANIVNNTFTYSIPAYAIFHFVLNTGVANTTCSAPKYIYVARQSTTSSTILWNKVAGVATYQLRYRPTGTSAWVTKSTTATNLALTALLPDTKYDFQMRSKCGTTYGPWGSINYFQTDAGIQPCTAPIPVMEQAANTATVVKEKLWWTYVPNATSYQLRYRKTSVTTWTTTTATVPNKLLTVSANTYYIYQVRALCSDGNYTAWSSEHYFTSTALGMAALNIADIEPTVNDEIKIFPNPVTDELNIDFNNFEIQKMSIMNVDGKIIMEFDTENITNYINVNELPTGIYLVRIETTENQLISKKFIKL